jgi:preprotein translocase subunit SecF
MSRLGRLGNHLYEGKVSFDFVGRRKLWYTLSALIVAIAIVGLVFRGLNFGIDFKGGVQFQAQITDPSSQIKKLNDAVVGTDIGNASHPVVVASGQHAVQVTTKTLTTDEIQVVQQALVKAGASEVSPSSVGATWGAQIAKKALLGLGVFLVLVVIFIWAYFREWRMSVAALVALAHDVLITVGVYALAGFEVTPATVTGLLTILGYSLYDTVVVFDKVRENTKGIVNSTRRTYAEAANLAVNQTLVRSINTSIAALLPVAALLYVGAFYLGSGPLEDLALSLFVGMAAGTYSSIFIATPLLAQLKMHEPAMVTQARRVSARRNSQARQVVAKAGGITGPDPGLESPDNGTSDGAVEPDEETVPSRRVTPAPVRTSVSRPPRTPRPTSTAAAKRSQPQRQARSKRNRKS